jgi:hypothetical protein
MIVDINTQKYLNIFEAAKQSFNAAVKPTIWLDDVRRCPSSALQYHFLENGLVYPDFPEATDDIKRNILLHSERIHSSRFTVAGLRYYLSFFVNVSVSVSVSGKNILQLNIPTMGLPNHSMLVTAETSADSCCYLFSNKPFLITITFAAGVSNAMKEWFRNTLKYEIPFGDANSSINLVFA